MSDMSKTSRTTTPPACPQCGSTQVVPILYGLPSYEAVERAERGEFALGGCVISDDSPK